MRLLPSVSLEGVMGWLCTRISAEGREGGESGVDDPFARVGRPGYMVDSCAALMADSCLIRARFLRFEEQDVEFLNLCVRDLGPLAK